MELELHEIELKYEHLRTRSSGRLERLIASLASEGQQMPVVVVGDASEGYVLIDGYRRVEALRKLGRDLVRASVLALSEPEALIWSWAAARGGGRSSLEEAWLLHELCEHHGLELGELATRFGRSKSWVSRRLALVRDVPEEVCEAVREGTLSPQAVMKYLVPLARANALHCVELVRCLRGKGVSVRQLGRLWAAWRAGDEEQRGRIVAHPHLFLRAQGELNDDEVVETEDVWERVVVRDLKMIAAISLRVFRQLDKRRRHHGRASTSGPLLAETWQEARAAVNTLEPLVRPPSGA
jgi:ParB/RepB/Spo0J family partition protein